MSIKEDFMNYIGPEDSLAGYSRSYKLVFLMLLLEYAMQDRKVKVIDIARQFKKFYEQRKEQGLSADKDIDPRIENIEQSTISQVISVIKDNPYKVINEKGFIHIETINNEECFVFSRELLSQLDKDDMHMLWGRLSEKLKLYYRRIDNGVNVLSQNREDALKYYFDEVMNKYITARTTEMFANNPLGRIIRNSIPDKMKNLIQIDIDTYKVKGSCGMGGWSYTPWVAISDKRITTSIEAGIYIVYLFSKDMQQVYLTLNQGCTKLRQRYGPKETISKLQQRAKEVRAKIDSDYFVIDNDLSVGDRFYEQGCIFYKAYEKGNIPDDEQLKIDLERMLDIYKKYYQVFHQKTNEQGETADDFSESIDIVTDFDVSEEVIQISQYIRSKGFTYEEGLITNFYLALKSKPFVILAGTSGTGKSKLVKLFAEAIGATSENSRFKLIPVRPDWSDSTDLLGYRDLNGKFNAGMLTNIILKAKQDPNLPYFVCLDEMNLARVEYYLSDVLSVMETRRKVDGVIKTDCLIVEESLGTRQEDIQLYKSVCIPDNLYIIGTVNMDETTFPFSKKVLDRANTIEFSYVDLDIRTNIIEEQQSVLLHNDFLKSDYLILDDCLEHEDIINTVVSILKEINEILYRANLHFGYRVRDEICFYIVYNNQFELITLNNAMDNEILQKILPRIQGSSMSIKKLLIDMFKVCINNSAQVFSYDSNDVNDEMFKYIKGQENIPYKKSAEKVAFMMRRFEEDGFTSYWL